MPGWLNIERPSSELKGKGRRGNGEGVQWYFLPSSLSTSPWTLLVFRLSSGPHLAQPNHRAADSSVKPIHMLVVDSTPSVDTPTNYNIRTSPKGREAEVPEGGRELAQE